MKNFSLSLVKQDIMQVKNYYPELYYKVLVVNSEFLVTMIWKICKTFLSKRIVEKIEFINES